MNGDARTRTRCLVSTSIPRGFHPTFRAVIHRALESLMNQLTGYVLITRKSLLARSARHLRLAGLDDLASCPVDGVTHLAVREAVGLVTAAVLDTQAALDLLEGGPEAAHAGDRLDVDELVDGGDDHGQDQAVETDEPWGVRRLDGQLARADVLHLPLALQREHARALLSLGRLLVHQVAEERTLQGRLLTALTAALPLRRLLLATDRVVLLAGTRGGRHGLVAGLGILGHCDIHSLPLLGGSGGL